MKKLGIRAPSAADIIQTELEMRKGGGDREGWGCEVGGGGVGGGGGSIDHEDTPFGM